MADEPLPDSPVVNPDGSVPPLSVGGIRRGLASIASFVILLVVIGKKVISDPKLVTADEIDTLLTLGALAIPAAISLYVGIRTILKRIHVGNDPANPAPPIALPVIVQRLTK